MTGSYIQDLTAGGLLLPETRTWLSIRGDKRLPDFDLWLEALPTRSEATAKRYFQIIQNRLSTIPEVALIPLKQAHGESFALMMLLTTMQRTPLVKHCVKELYCEAKRTYQDALQRSSVTDVITQLCQTYAPESKVSENTFRKVETNLLRMFVESELVADAKQLKLLNVFALPEVNDFASQANLTENLAILECRV